MKKISKIKLIFNLFLFISMSTTLTAQWAITPNNGGTLPDVFYKVDENCEYQACFRTYLYSPNPAEFDSSEDWFTDPNGDPIPPLFLRVAIMGIDQVFPLTDWELFTNVQYLDPPGTQVIGVYRSTVCVDIDLSEQCLSALQPTEDPSPLDPATTVDVPYFIELLTISEDDDDSFEPSGPYYAYPICQYTDPGSIFSCNIFEHTEPYCQESAPECSNTDLYRIDDELELICEDCILANEGNGKGNFGNDDESFEMRNYQSTNLEISPNPFMNFISIKIPNIENTAIVELFDNMGQKIKSIKTKEPILELQTNELNKGLYYLVIQNGERNETFKILKNNMN